MLPCHGQYMLILTGIASGTGGIVNTFVRHVFRKSIGLAMVSWHVEVVYSTLLHTVW